MIVPDAERGDHRIDPRLGDDQAVDEADQRADAMTMSDGERDRQPVVDDEAGDQHAVHARGEADRQIELADDDGDGQPAGDDHRERRLVEDVGEVASVGKARGERIEKTTIISDQADDGAVAGEEAERRLASPAQAPRCANR